MLMKFIHVHCYGFFCINQFSFVWDFENLALNGNASISEFLTEIKSFTFWVNFFFRFSPKQLAIPFMIQHVAIPFMIQHVSLTYYCHFIIAVPELIFLYHRKSRASFCNLTLMAVVRATSLAWVASVTSCVAGVSSAQNACDAVRNGACAQMSNPTKSC